MIRADTELRYMKGVGPRRADALAKGGLATVEDLLYLLPSRYEDRRRFARIDELQPGAEERTLEGRRLAALVLALPGGERDVVLLRFVGGLSYREVAQCCDIREDAARQRCRAALRRLRGAVAAEAPLAVSPTGRLTEETSR